MKQGATPVSLPCAYSGYNVWIRCERDRSMSVSPDPKSFEDMWGFLSELVNSLSKNKQIPDMLSCQLTHFCNIAHIIPSFIYRRFTNQREG